MTFQRLTNSLATRIIVLGIVFVLLGTLLRSFVLSRYLREDIGAVVAAQQLTLANYVARDVNQKLLARQRLLKHMAETLTPDLIERPTALRQWLAIRYDLQPLFSQGLFVTDTAGKVVTDYPHRPARDGLNYGDRDYVRAAMAGEFSTGNPVIGRVAKKPVLPMAAPIKDATGTVRAVLVGITALDAAGFLSFDPQDRIGEQGGFLLISPRDRVFVASTNPGMVLTPTPPDGVNPLHDRAMKGYRGSGITVNAQGVEEISAMASVPSTGWFVVARIPTSEALAVVSRAQGFIAKNSILAVLAFILVGTGSMVYVFRPLLHAADHADRMTRGEAPLEPLAVVRNDEVGHLTEAYNRLLAKLKASQSEMAHMAHHDVLTGLPNRTLLADRLSHAIARANRHGTRLGLLYIDLDRFKPINDKLGHKAGDEALKVVALRLAAIVRESDTLARVGGDEFIVLLGDLDSVYAQAESAACAVAAKCLEAIETPLTVQGEVHSMGASIGIAMGDGLVSPHDLQVAADAAMYQAKQAGGQRFCVATTTAHA